MEGARQEASRDPVCPGQRGQLPLTLPELALGTFSPLGGHEADPAWPRGPSSDIPTSVSPLLFSTLIFCCAVEDTTLREGPLQCILTAMPVVCGEKETLS